VGNNPINLVDPSGEFAFLPLLAVGLAGGVLGGAGYYGIKTALNPCAEWNWGEAALWSGAGAVIGATTGTAIYGGWWVGAQVGWWGSTAGTTASTAATYACADGDCTNEVSVVGRTLRNVGNVSQSLLEAPTVHKHHIFPQKFRIWFAQRSIDIDLYTIKLSRSIHLRGIHGKGGFVGPGSVEFPGKWNSYWQAFIDTNPHATPKEVYQFGGYLMDLFGLSDIAITPY
jgi:hypothetical protein